MPRICTKSEKDIEKKRQEETAEELRVTEEIKDIRKKKRDKKIEEMSQPCRKRKKVEIAQNDLNFDGKKISQKVTKDQKKPRKVTKKYRKVTKNY